MPKSKRFKTKRDDAAKNYQEKMRILYEKQERAVRKRKTI